MITTVERQGQKLRLAYLCAQYPAISHTFILREVDALRRLGAEIDTFSIRRTPAEHLLADADRTAFQSTYAILPARVLGMLMGHLKLALRAPSAYVSTLLLALGLSAGGLRARLWQLFYFVESVVLWDECSRRDIRHIHVHLANGAADVALLAAKIGSALDHDRPWSWSFTMHGPTEFSDVRYFRLPEKLQQARFVVCISDYARSQLMTLSRPDVWDKLHVVHVGIPIEQFTQTDALNSGAEDSATILLIGRQVPEKGQAVLLEAAQLLIGRGQQITVVLAGDGPARAELEQLASQLGVAERVSFLGAVGQQDVHRLYAHAAIFCLPSFAEGVPVVLMEAMAMSLPVVSTRITGIPELIDDQSGVLVSPGRADELANALERLLVDPSLRERMGASGRDKVIREFNLERSAEQLYELFHRELAPVPGEGDRAGVSR